MEGLRLEGVSRVFSGVAAVDTVDLVAAPGEVLCLLGPSGCGKTTTLRLAAGLEAADRGRIFVDGRTVDADGRFVPPERRRVGLVFQDYALFPHLTVLENVMFGVREGDRARTARDLLRRVGMADAAGGYPHTLSGGEQQRVALARALAPRPAVMLMDEPFSGLDFRLRDRVGEASLSLLRETGTATLMVTHDSEEAMRLADRIALMRDGRIVQTGTPGDLYRFPADDFVAEFLSETNRLRGVVREGRVATAAGSVDAPHLAEGAPALVMLRPEAVRVAAAGAARAIVLEARPMGAWTLARLRLDGVEAGFVARLPADCAPGQGETVRFDLDPNACYVFAASGPRGG